MGRRCDCHSSGPRGEAENPGQGPSWLRLGSTLAGGALQHLGSNRSCLVTDSSPMPRYCHSKSVFIRTLRPHHFRFSLTRCAHVDF